MPRALAADGTGLHWEERGSGQTMVLAAHWSYHPSLWEPLTADLVTDSRVVRYDDRGTGRSDRVGPYDLETAADDLEAVLEASGDGPAVVIGLMDGINRAVRVAARRPDLVSHVVSAAGAPLPREALQGFDSMIASDTVVGAFMQQLENDYRGALRGLVEASNPQMSQDDVRARVAGQVEYVPLEAAAPRIREWSEDDDGVAPSRELGDRLMVLLAADISGGWFPGPEVLEPILREHFPEMRIEHVESGILSRPDQTADVARRLAAEVTADRLESAS